ncbi:hypothetical protein [Azospirillum sp.]|uniref:hypothetical protein n=1 Tax=Azospirillum sp. TaxID=34012 RepID=UPI002D4029BE|nr:hypothetical protein [Azospirillum sp.]HYD64190.1 hypothetical protein [Azospirillum sp.]
MLTIEDCIALSDLSEEEIDAIAEHEHLPEMLAVELGCCLEHDPEGRRRIAAFIRDDIANACAHGDSRHAAALMGVLRVYLSHHKDLYAPRNGTGNMAA